VQAHPLSIEMELLKEAPTSVPNAFATSSTTLKPLARVVSRLRDKYYLICKNKCMENGQTAIQI
jgi:hypothetical protein